jgi:DNA-binding CsgD family transcriptional regulator
VLSGHTVKTHINRIFAKTGSRDRTAAVAYARRHQLD